MPSRRSIRRFLFALALTILGAVAALVVINQIDETLSPEAAAFYESGTLRPLTEKHGFALIVGMSAPVDQDPRSFAVAWARETARAIKLKTSMPERTNGLKAMGADELFCLPEKVDCIDRYRANPRAIDDLVADNTILLRRYRELARETDLSDAFETMSPEASTFDAELMERAQAIVLSQVAVHSIREEWDAALDLLGQDTTLYRRWLSQSSSLICKIFAARMLRRDLMVALQISRRVESLRPAHHETLRRIATPLTSKELGLEAAVRIESALIPILLDRVVNNRSEMMKLADTGVLASHLMSLTILRNATLNIGYRPYELMSQFDFADSRNLPGQIDKWHKERDRLTTPDWKWLYNPAGRMFLAGWLGSNSFWDLWITRVRDADGLSRLVCATIDLLLSRVSSNDVAAHLATSDPRCHDPYTGGPMRWDAESRELWFKPADPKYVAVFAGKGERVGLRLH